MSPAVSGRGPAPTLPPPPASDVTREDIEHSLDAVQARLTGQPAPTYFGELARQMMPPKPRPPEPDYGECHTSRRCGRLWPYRNTKKPRCATCLQSTIRLERDVLRPIEDVIREAEQRAWESTLPVDTFNDPGTMPPGSAFIIPAFFGSGTIEGTAAPDIAPTRPNPTVFSRR